jgi:SAM-dependent methyltransferase
LRTTTAGSRAHGSTAENSGTRGCIESLRRRLPRPAGERSLRWERVQTLNLPYFDAILDRLDRDPESELAAAFRKHVHWGSFPASARDDDSLEAYLEAAEALTSRVCELGRVADGARILDVGCGFGGTLAHLNERLSGCELVGLNIDARQIDRARRSVIAARGNTVEFVVGDACAMPLGGRTFDVVLAVECIFHFPSRKQFFREVSKVLAPGGTLALSDFVVREGALLDLADWMTSNALPASQFYGHSSAIAPTPSGYGRIARGQRFDVVADVDITESTLPTYAAMRRLYREAGVADGVRATDYLESLARQRLVQYRLLSFSPQPAPAPAPA